MKSKTFYLGLFLCALLVVAGCTQAPQVQQPTTPIEMGEITFGYIGPLTGDVAFVGQDNKKAIELAVEEINALGGINGKTLRVIYEDAKCNPKEASVVGNKLINVDKVKFIVGAGCSGETLAVAPLAEENKVLMLSPISSSPDIRNAGDYIFRNYANDNDNAKEIASKMQEERLMKTAVLVGLTDWGEATLRAFESFYQGEVVVRESFKQGDTDFRSILSKVKQSGADSIIFLDYTASATAFYQQKKEMGIDLPVYGGDPLSDPDILKNVGNAMDGTNYFLLKQDPSESFKAKMKQRTGEDAVLPGSPNAYDAVYILVQAIKAVGEDSTKVKEYLYSMQPYKGESGTIEFDEFGDMKNTQFTHWKVQNGVAQTMN